MRRLPLWWMFLSTILSGAGVLFVVLGTSTPLWYLAAAISLGSALACLAKFRRGVRDFQADEAIQASRDYDEPQSRLGDEEGDSKA